jgi:hypothetical protein
MGMGSVSVPGSGSGSSSGARGQDWDRDRESKVAKIAADDDEATRRALNGFVMGADGCISSGAQAAGMGTGAVAQGSLYLEYLEWMSGEILSAAVEEGDVRCRNCVKPIGTWTWTPTSR